MASKPYMPLMMGDWIMGTRGMRAEVKGVYIGLLIHQYHHGYLPANLEDLALIEPEVVRVWVSHLEEKFPVYVTGRRRNEKLEEVRDFWSKQSNNGKKGGRPKKITQTKPKGKASDNPTANPDRKLYYDLDLDTDLELKFKEAFDEIFLEDKRMKWRQLDVNFEFKNFLEKVRDSPTHYQNHNADGLRLAFNKQLTTARPKNKFNEQVKGTSRTTSAVIGEPDYDERL